ncbi:hypothetical protein AVEN_94580-1 [Araneus ventricosus]|uniref:THAP-type domain-containing protein n=1 Tax=Araneus ventricosus TaxID=182803 RepID=A0A4Y2K5W8_ARAVE|nr:hypothetical protein AVEN_94580-1 [Araneus ventricosus]
MIKTEKEVMIPWQNLGWDNGGTLVITPNPQQRNDSLLMPNTCCVTNCRGNYDAENKVAVFSFPKVEELKLKWIQAIPRRDLVVTKNTKVCEKHFTDDDIERVSTFYKESTGETLIAKLKKPRLK